MVVLHITYTTLEKIRFIRKTIIYHYCPVNLKYLVITMGSCPSPFGSGKACLKLLQAILSRMPVSESNSIGSNLNVLCTTRRVKCMDALNNPATLQALRSLGLRHKHSEMTILSFFIFTSKFISSSSKACCISPENRIKNS